MCVAFSDESMRSMPGEPMYLVGATIFHASAENSTSSLVALKPSGAKKLHWRELGREVQAQALDIVAEAPVTTSIIIATPMNIHKQERARRKCLELLLPALERDGIHRLVMESRNELADRRDVELVSALRSRKLVSSVRIEHVRGEFDPRLWYPDLVLGAFGDELCDVGQPDDWLAAWQRAEQSVHFDIVEP